MKQFVTILLSLSMLLSINTIAFASSDVKIKVNGDLISDAQAVLKDGSTLLPVRSVSTALGGNVVWDNVTKTASIDKDDTQVSITIGEKSIFVNGTKQTISTPAQIISGRTYVPLRALGEALSCDIAWVNETKTVEISQENPAEYEAWYEVDEDGNLSIKTNINSSKWGGYSILVKCNESGGNNRDSQSGTGMVKYDCNSWYSSFDKTIHSTDFYVFKGRNWNEYWTLWESLKNHDKVIAAMGDKVVFHTKLNNVIKVKEADQPVIFKDFNITYDKAKQEETYTAIIEGEIQKNGQYGLSYDGKSRGNAGFSHIRKGNDCLTFTRELYHFANSGASGTFYINYCEYSMDDNGSITITKTQSNGIDYKFPLYY